VNGFVLAVVDGVAEEIPKREGEEVFLSDKVKTPGYAIVQDVVAVAGQWLEAGEQIVDQLVERDLDATSGGLEGYGTHSGFQGDRW
jgi:hypothetical protein